MKQVKNTLIVLFAIALMSCGGGSSEDKKAPTVSISTPAAGASVNAGSNLAISASVADNDALASYTLTIVYSGAKTVKIVTPERFSFNSNSDATAEGNAVVTTLSGKTQNISFNVAIPADAEDANYKLTLTVLDETGNSTSEDVTFGINN